MFNRTIKKKKKMLRALDSGSGEAANVRFGEASHDLLTDFLTQLNTQNKEKLHTLADCCGSFKDRRLMGESR